MCDLKSNLSLLLKVDMDEDKMLNKDEKEKQRMEKMQEATDRRQFNFQKKVDVSKLERHGSIMTNVLSEAQFSQKNANGTFAGFGGFIGVGEEGEEEGEKERKEGE